MAYTLESIAGDWQAPLEPGQTYYLGRDAALAQFAFPEDTQLSRLHVAFDCTADELFIRDLGSASGFLLNGKRAKQAALAPGDWLTIGDLILQVNFTPDEEEAEPLYQEDAAAAAAKILRTETRPLYALLDAARGPEVALWISQSMTIRWQSLFGGSAGLELAAQAPYLIEVEPRGAWLETLLQQSWSASWGVFVTSSAGFDALRAHLRQQLLVKNPQGRTCFFRFYDPRVLRPFLASSRAAQRTAFFGPASSFWCESDDGRAWWEFTAAVDRPRRLALDTAQEALHG
jgi:hypothetical protein